jgi:hypothetical protein
MYVFIADNGHKKELLNNWDGYRYRTSKVKTRTLGVNRDHVYHY